MKWIIFAGALALIFPSCTKHNNTPIPPNGISCQIDGKPITFNAYIWIDTLNSAVIINGAADSSTGLPQISIGIYPAGTLVTGAYPNQSVAVAGQNASIVGFDATYGTGIANELFFNSSDDTVQVSTVNSAVITGSFQGTGTCQYFDPNTSSLRDSTVTITVGKFNVRL